MLTTLSLTILAYLHSFSCCCVRNLRNPEKFTKNSNLWSSRSSKFIDLGVNGKPICDFILVINNKIFAVKDRKLLIYTPLPCLTPPSGGTPWDIDVIYTPLKSAFNGIPSLTLRVYLHSFSRGCLAKSRNHAKFRQNLTLQQFKVIQGHRSWCQSKAHIRLPISH